MTRVYCLNCGEKWILDKDAEEFLFTKYRQGSSLLKSLNSLQRVVTCCHEPNLLYALGGEKIKRGQPNKITLKDILAGEI